MAPVLLKLYTDSQFTVPVWFFRMLAKIPGAAAGYWRFIDYCSDQLKNRMKVLLPTSITLHCSSNSLFQMKASQPDIMTPILAPYQARDPKGLEWSYLQGDSRLIIVAGR